MEKNKLELEDIIENPEHYFTTLRPASETCSKINYLNVNVEGYSDLFSMIMDLLKTAMFAIEGMENSNYYLRDDEKCIAGHLRVIEMLLPLGEGEMLDILYSKYVKMDKDKSDTK
ncbi:hypothetical protein [Flavobacterium bizetiae]|uniref:hypothetical protein n=1 Tax=Flavobacterium bizetiae TaxID=2704140 RepID=UPI0037577F57